MKQTQEKLTDAEAPRAAASTQPEMNRRTGEQMRTDLNQLSMKQFLICEAINHDTNLRDVNFSLFSISLSGTSSVRGYTPATRRRSIGAVS
jgi:hypothetical protein